MFCNGAGARCGRRRVRVGQPGRGSVVLQCRVERLAPAGAPAAAAIWMAPLAASSSLVGLAVDRLPHAGSGSSLPQSSGRAGRVPFRPRGDAAAGHLYPVVLLLLIASKASGIVKQTLVQTLVDDPEELVSTNARLVVLECHGGTRCRRGERVFRLPAPSVCGWGQSCSRSLVRRCCGRGHVRRHP